MAYVGTGLGEGSSVAVGAGVSLGAGVAEAAGAGVALRGTGVALAGAEVAVAVRAGSTLAVAGRGTGAAWVDRLQLIVTKFKLRKLKINRLIGLILFLRRPKLPLRLKREILSLFMALIIANLSVAFRIRSFDLLYTCRCGTSFML
jgi:hypothetical protein